MLIKKENVMVINMLKILVTILSMLAINTSMAFCHGWGAYDQGAKARSMAGAYTGLADDPSAIFYNPAGITQLDGNQLSAGFLIPIIRGHFESDGTSGIPGTSQGDETHIKDQLFIIPNLYFTYRINDKLSLGIGEYTTFGLGFEWPDSFEGRFGPGGINGEIQTMTLNPVAAYKVMDSLSLSFGARLQRAKINLKNNIFIASGVDEVRSEIAGDNIGIGWNAGLLYKINEELSMGLSYRSAMKHSFCDLDVGFSPQIEMLGSFPIGILNTKADLDVTLPQFASFGFAWSKGPFTMTFDGYWWDWSEIDRLAFKLHDPVAGQKSLEIPMNWENTWSWAIGGEYIINALDRDISLRAGIMYDKCPTPDETVGLSGFQGSNILYCLGIGSMVGPFYSDFCFSYIDYKDRTYNNANGDAPNPGGGRVTGQLKGYETILIGANLTYKF